MGKFLDLWDRKKDGSRKELRSYERTMIVALTVAVLFLTVIMKDNVFRWVEAGFTIVRQNREIEHNARQIEELERRLVGRGTETPEVVHDRLCRAGEECQGVEAYDYLIVNDDLETCVEQVHSILQNEHTRIFRNEAFIHHMKTELAKYAKGE